MNRCISSEQRRRRTNAKSWPNAGSLSVQLLVTSELTSVLIGARRQTASSSMWPYCVHHFLQTKRAPLHHGGRKEKLYKSDVLEPYIRPTAYISCENKFHTHHEAKSFLSTNHGLRLFWNHNVHYRIQNNLTPNITAELVQFRKSGVKISTRKHQLPWLRFLVVFLGPSRRIWCTCI